MAWSIIPPAIGDFDNVFYFSSTGTSEYSSFMIAFDYDKFDEIAAYLVNDGKTISFEPAYYDGYAYYHYFEDVYTFNYNEETPNRLFEDSNISYNGSNLNSTIVISSNNNLLFVCGYSLCAYDLFENKILWCNKLDGGSNQGITPAISEIDNYVYIYDNGYIKCYHQFSGKLISEYGNGELKNECNLEYGCLSSQPIITQYNIFWADGRNVYIFEFNNPNEILLITEVGEECVYFNQIGNSIAVYKKYLIVTCSYQFDIYTFDTS